MAREKKTPKFDADAFGEGYDAYCNGLDITDNPFDANKDPVAHRSWEDAWREGQAHDEEEREQQKHILTEAGAQGMTLADLLPRLDGIDPHRSSNLLDGLIRNGEVSVSEASSGTSVFRATGPHPDIESAMPPTVFPLTTIQRLRKQAVDAAHSDLEPPQGWSKSVVDPMGVLSAFTPLRIKSGFVLRAYQFCEGGNGNGFVWALPMDAPFPEPDECPRLEQMFLAPPKPPAALEDVMDAIEGDGTPWSYLCASLFCREIHEFGAMWHGANWSTHTILGKNPLKARRSRRGRLDEPSAPPEQWTWAEPEPVEWKPQVAENGDSITVVFFTFSGLGQETIFRHTDIFRRGSYRLVTDRQEIATGSGGYVC